MGHSLLREAKIYRTRFGIARPLTESSAVEIASLLEVAPLEVAAAAVMEGRSAVIPSVVEASANKEQQRFRLYELDK